MFTLFETSDYLLGFNGSRPEQKVGDDLSGVTPERSSAVTAGRISDVKAKPSLELKAGSSHEVKNNPLPNARAQPCSDVSDVRTNPLPNVRAQPCFDVRTNPLPNVRAQPCSDVRTNPLPNVRAQPCSDVRTNPLPNVRAQPCSDVRTKPLPNVSAQPCSDIRTNPVPGGRSERSPGIRTGQSSEPVPDPPAGPMFAVPHQDRTDPTHGVKTDPTLEVRMNSIQGNDHLLLSSWGLPREVLLQYKQLGITSMFPWQHDCLLTGNVLGGTLFHLLHLLATTRWDIITFVTPVGNY